MDQSYAATEIRIKEAINAINTRKNAKHSAIAREFHVIAAEGRVGVLGIKHETSICQYFVDVEQ